MTDKTPSDYFARVKALQEMILNAQEDLKQLRVDAMEEMGVDDMPKEQAQEIRADWTAMVAVARLDVKGEIERRKHARKQARMKRMAEECGVQLDLLDDTDAGAAQRMARVAVHPAAKRLRDSIARGEVEITVGNERLQSNRMGGVESVNARDPSPHHTPHDPETGEVLDDDEEQKPASTSEEPAVMHAGGMSDADFKALGDIPEFLRR